MDYLYFNNNGPYKVYGSFVNKHGEAAGDTNALSAPAQNGFASTNIHVVVGNIDYSRQLHKKLKLEAGIKNTYTQNNGYSGFESLINGVWTNNEQAVNNIEMEESIHAAYASFNIKPNESTNITAGLRYEYAYTNMQNAVTGKEVTNRKQGVFFPNIFFAKKINSNSTLQLSYTKRISRPSYNDLASYVGYSDPTAVYTGNPYLLPAVSHNLSTGYTYKKYVASLSFSREKNGIARYQLGESAGHDMLIISPQNISWQNILAFQTILPFKLNNWWQMSNTFNAGWHQYKVDYTSEPFINSFATYGFTSSQLLKLPRQYSIEISGNLNSAGYAGTQKVQGFFLLNIGAKKELPKNAGNLQLTVSDVLLQQQYDIHYGLVTREAFDIQSHVLVKTETTRFPVIMFTYSKSFGRNISKTSRNNNSGDAQERVRKE